MKEKLDAGDLTCKGSSGSIPRGHRAIIFLVVWSDALFLITAMQGLFYHRKTPWLCDQVTVKEGIMVYN